MPFLELVNVKKQFGGVRAVDDVSLAVEEGEFLVLVGPSGCGKTTLLRMIAGLEETTDGTIIIAGKDVTAREPGDRDVAMVFQNYALFPHMTVFDNMSFGMRMAGVPKTEIESRVSEAARFLQLTDMLKRKPAQLSGGQRQRVAMGRAIVRRPNAFLMDEPLSNLDANLRVQMRAEISRIQKDLGVTTVYVTHDQIEAMTMADRVAVLHKGILQQAASPAILYDEPANVFVASFLGSPSMSLVEAGVEATASGVTLKVGPQSIQLSRADIERFPKLPALSGKRVVVGLRPEDIGVAEAQLPEPGYALFGDLPAQVVLTEMLGADEIVYAQVEADWVSSPQLRALLAAADPLTTADSDPSRKERRPLMICRSSRRTATVRRGDHIRLCADLTRLHLFDSSTGLSLRASGGSASSAAMAAPIARNITRKV
ncbi:ABC transporter ATP-binding protein [Devosia sp.]|jgi:multiple sugar transport system ATP-binding protein|uniref:ABC transporter ATP-binding protein n=1 Tax=Devosia sp. TaxID=1871048 RepID=UPI0037BF354F